MLLICSIAATAAARRYLSDPTPYGPVNWRRPWLAARLETAYWLACIFVAALFLVAVVTAA